MPAMTFAQEDAYYDWTVMFFAAVGALPLEDVEYDYREGPLCRSCDALLFEPTYCPNCDGTRGGDIDLEIHEALWPTYYGCPTDPGANDMEAGAIVHSYRGF